MEHDSHAAHQYGQPRPGAPQTSAVSSAVATPQHRPGTPSESLAGMRDPFRDGSESQASQRTGNANGLGTAFNPFSSPVDSRPVSSMGSSSALDERHGAVQRYFKSRRVRKGEIEKPWLQKRDPKEKWVTIMPLIGIFLGLCISGVLVWDGLRSVVHHDYCPVLDDDFSGGLSDSSWVHEVNLGGFGNGEFEMTTSSSENVYVENGHLFIKATLQDEKLIQQNSAIDLSKKGSKFGQCTSKLRTDCYAVTNTTAGNATIVPPVVSGRITTKGKHSIKYGRVEVTAKLPRGDWLWPAIWMMPVEDTYGPWPLSGEIDIIESRGNNYTYSQGGNNIVSSALHWGPDTANDAWWRTNVKRPALHTTYADGFNVFGLEWSQKYLFTYVNGRLLQTLYTNFDRPMWQRGNFPAANSNGTRLNDVWSSTGRDNTPFDQEFYLILNLAAGGTNGWFEDGESNKPWLNGSPNAPKDFWTARSEWLPTWTQPALEISKVQMWQQCDPGDADTEGLPKN